MAAFDESREHPSGSITIGTRGSRLALWQAAFVSRLLASRFPSLKLSIETIQTEGDRFADRPISLIGDKGMFVRHIERALLDGKIDLAVHSLKDVPSDSEAPGLVVGAFSTREDPRDVLVSVDGRGLDDLDARARIGTSSLRRRVQLREARPDLGSVDIRGNIDTRLKKLDVGEYDALILAAAGLKRLDLAHRITEHLDLDRFIPDAGQGILALQVRAEDVRMRDIVAAINDPEGETVARAERAVVRAMAADCRSPVGAHARVIGDSIHIAGVAASDLEGIVYRASVQGAAREPEEAGRRLGSKLLRLLEPARGAQA